MDAGQLQVSVMETPGATLPCGFKAGFHGNARVSWSCVFQGANVNASELCARFLFLKQSQAAKKSLK